MAVFTAIGASLFGAGTFLAGLTAAGLQIASGIGLSLISKAMQGEPQPSRFGVQGQVQTGDQVPRSILFGYSCTAGSKVYQNEWGGGSVYSTRVIALADYPIREIREVIVDGVPCTLAGSAHASYGYPVLEYRKGGKDHLWVKFYDGTQTTADTFLTGTVSSTARPYGANRVGKGVPYVICTSLAPERNDTEEKPLFQGFPQFKFVVYGAKLYDPSKDTSVGGSGTQRWADPSTWGGDGDFLPPVQIYNVLRGIRFNSQWLYGLQTLSAARLPVASWIEAINASRATIAGPDGSEPTFRSGGEIQVGAPIHVALEAMATACNGRISETGGSYRLIIGAAGSPVMSFTDGDILSTEEQRFTPFFSLADTVNGVAANFPNPGEGWNSKAAPTLLRPDLEVLDGGRRLLTSVDFDMVPYPAQVQRLMKWALAEALRARKHTFTLGPEFRVVEPGDIVRWSSDRNGYVDKLFRVDGLVYKANLDVIVDLTEVDPSDYDWDQEVDYTPVVDGVLQLVGPLPMPMQGWAVYPDQIRDQNGVSRRPSVRVEFASGLSNVDRVRVQVRTAGETDPFFDGSVEYADPWKTILQAQFAPNQQVQVRGIFIMNGNGVGEWSDWLSVTTPNVGLADTDLAQFLQDKLDYADQTLRSLQERIDDLDQTQASQASWNRDVYVKQGNNLAAVVRQTEAILESDYAKASDLTLVEARVDGVDASGLFGVTSTVDEGAGEVLIQMAARVASGDTIVTSGLGVGVSGGIGYIYLDADSVIATGKLTSETGASYLDLNGSGGLRIST